jgi:hypothetical protein
MARFARAALAVAILASSFALVAGSPATAASATVTNAANWLRSQQEADGGFELADFPPLETPDAVLALGVSAQTGASWSATQARAAVLGTSTAGGKTPLDAVDDYVSGSIGHGQAGKIITLVTNPLALDPANFDPSGNGAVNLVTKLGTPAPDDKFGIALGAFNDILFAVRGYALITSVPTATITVIRNAQKSDGSWAFNGVNTGVDGGADTTGLAVQALLDAGVPASDPDVAQALGYLEAQQQPDGGFTDGFSENPNTSAVAMLALAAAGDTGPLVDGDAYLVAQQQVAGNIASPYDSTPPNTFATSQAIEALVRPSIPAATSLTNPVTVPSATGGGALSLESSAGTLTNVAAVDPATLPAPPTGASFPKGLISFKVTRLTNGATATVRVVLPVGTTANRYFKFDGSTWIDATPLASFSGNVVTLTLTDGGLGDEDHVANGTIVDPGGPATVAAALATVARFTG